MIQIYDSRRFDNTIKKLEEEETIIFFLSCVIIHELGHLLTRWNGVKSFRDNFKDDPTVLEAGHYMEKLVFGNSVRLLVSKSSLENNSGHFDSMTSIKGLKIYLTLIKTKIKEL